MPIDNNAVERTGPSSLEERTGCSVAGATASTQLYSLVETAKANSEKPYAWLRLPQAA